MNYKILLVANKRYFEETNWDESYDVPFSKREIWENLDNICLEDIENVILKFLNDWKCRIPKNRASEMLNTLKGVNQLFVKLKGKTLENLNFDVETEELITSIYEKISSVTAPACAKGGRGHTAASKTMHMVIPDLFPMWDAKIRKGYGFTGNKIGYLHFLMQMKKLINKIVDEYCKEFNCNKEKAKKEIKNMMGGKSLTKLIDQYNYMEYTRGIKFE